MWLIFIPIFLQNDVIDGQSILIQYIVSCQNPLKPILALLGTDQTGGVTVWSFIFLLLPMASVCMLLMCPYVLDALCASLKLQRNSCSLSLDTCRFITLHDVNYRDPNNKQQIWRPIFWDVGIVFYYSCLTIYDEIFAK